MKIFHLLILLIVTGANCQAQIDKILAPIPASDPERLEVASGSQQGGKTAEPAAKKAAARQWVKAEDLLQRLQKQIGDYYSVKGDFKLDFTRPWQAVEVPAGDFDLVLSDFPGEGLSSNFFVRCKMIAGGATVGEWQLALRAQLWQEVWGAQSRLDRGQELQRSILSVQKVDVLRDKQAFISAADDPSIYNVILSVPAGRPLAKQDVIERPLIHRGHMVEVVVKQGLLNIRMKAVALEDGGANAFIRMRNLDSKKEFNAQIINENLVQVHF